ncbi:TadE/TadG family type IV pilus assembly protein [Fulvimarina sp. 2208YS6-2-32]|uniref:TadE/TadG family type IV pilus assembly protein n=1 Tax=Fulvimarina uroteuthidis TaxID=3098149 RepID=A0ABU5I441_9HYPH|nr:TadE/TadG family type IV pilus assembly protein [Fulvimarina sp. 2208YS6-2-32]MDY8110122.1 TadE/TadG family type IV pilus assembly protein [Fulvimarina sp. 2208YS6-2-32]
MAAVEFALIVPFFAFAFLAMVDTGLMISEKIAVDQLLRSGMQIAMTDPGTNQVYDAIVATGTSDYEIVAAPANADERQLSVDVTRFYACKEAPSVAVPAGTTCDDAHPTSAYYRVLATKPYDEIILPDLVLTAVLQVQVR